MCLHPYNLWVVVWESRKDSGLSELCTVGMCGESPVHDLVSPNSNLISKTAQKRVASDFFCSQQLTYPLVLPFSGAEKKHFSPLSLKLCLVPSPAVNVRCTVASCTSFWRLQLGGTRNEDQASSPRGSVAPLWLPTDLFHGKFTLCMRENCTSLEKLSKPGSFLAQCATGTAGALFSLPVQISFSLQGCSCLWKAAAFPTVRPGVSLPLLGTC